MQNLLQRGKYSKKKESQGKENRVHPQSQILKKLKGREEGKNVQGEKGEKKSHSSSSNVSNSDSITDSDSEASATDKRFKVILTGEKFKWNLPSSIAEYANNHFNSYIPDKDIEEQLLTENPVPSISSK